MIRRSGVVPLSSEVLALMIEEHREEEIDVEVCEPPVEDTTSVWPDNREVQEVAAATKSLGSDLSAVDLPLTSTIEGGGRRDGKIRYKYLR
eukprot:gene12497-511_t